MLNLIEQLTTLDNKRIENYIHEWGVEDGYIGNEKYLSYWAENKKKLFRLLGGNLIYKIPYKYEKSEQQFISELSKLHLHHEFIPKAYTALNKFVNKEIIPRDVDNALKDVFACSVLISDKVNTPIKFKKNGAKSTLQIQRGMKPIRAMQKIIQYFEFRELEDDFEDFRQQHSMILNEKELEGNLCISIHPLDFMTMSDNNSNWSSCMSWSKEGCYHEGTVEMMNSNNIVCAYLEGNFPYAFGTRESQNKPKPGDEWKWNNKKWRQLFCINKDIIVSGKPYPYVNEDMTKDILEIIRRLAKDNLGWIYSFGPELYQDMKHINNAYRMDMNRSWIASNRTIKHNIIFDTKGMYNDILNSPNTNYWCVRNKVKKNKIISYSGKAPCLCCMSPVILENDDYDYDYYEERSYNERFRNVNKIICGDCLSERFCERCGDDSGYYSVYQLNGTGEQFCKECWYENVRKCPDCGKPFVFNRLGFDSYYAKFTKDTLYTIDVRDKTKVKEIYACPDCLSKINSNRERIKVDITRQHYSWESCKYYDFLDGVYDKDDDFIKRHSKEYLEEAPLPEN